MMISAEEYAIFSAICRTDLFNWGTGVTFADETISNKITRAPLEYLSKLIRVRCLKHPELLQDFSIKNEQHWKIEKQFQVVNGFELLSKRKIVDSNPQMNLFSLSRVGFSHDGEFGLVYINYCGGPLVGVGYFLLFKRTEQGWQLYDQCTSFVS